MADDKGKQDLVLAVDRAVDILIALNKAENKTIREMSTELDISKSTLHRIIQTLEYRGLVKKNNLSEKYSLGYKILELAEGLKKDNELREVAYNHMQELSEDIGDTVQLATVENDEVVIIETVEGTSDLRLFAKPGQRYPLTYGNFGRVFLSEYDDKTLLNYINKDNELDKESFIADVKKVRAEGISVGIDYPIQGSISLAVPITNYEDNIIASLSIVGVKTEEKLDNIDFLKNAMKAIGDNISKEIN